MQVSEYYNLELGQAELDFVDVDVVRDSKLFVDPTAIRSSSTPWAIGCQSLLDDYFHCLTAEVRAGDREAVAALLSELREPNEVRLGFSKGAARGTGLGLVGAARLLDAFFQSPAVRDGIVLTLEDCAILVHGIGPDIVSDMAINIIRAELIEYTRSMCSASNIPIEDPVPSGPLWDTKRRTWMSRPVGLPVAGGIPLLLVPKSLVSSKLAFDRSEYSKYVLERLRTEELGDPLSELVRELKNGKRIVYKKDLVRRYGKLDSLGLALSRPDLVVGFRGEADARSRQGLSQEQLAATIGVARPDWETMVGNVVEAHSTDDYERKALSFLAALLHPNLVRDPAARSDEPNELCLANTGRNHLFQWLLSSLAIRHAHIMAVGAEIGSRADVDRMVRTLVQEEVRLGILVARLLPGRAQLEHYTKLASASRGLLVALIDNEDLSKMALLASLQMDRDLYLFLYTAMKRSTDAGLLQKPRRR